MEKACSHCGTQFSFERGNFRYCSRLCSSRAWWKRNKDKPSIKQRRRLYYEKNKEKVLTRSREWASANVDKRKRIARTYQVGLYGLTVEQYEVMHRRQEGKCLICDQQKVLVVDHNHQTNEVRGLLCGSCNRGIGLLKDDIMNLTKAIAYLERTPPQ